MNNEYIVAMYLRISDEEEGNAGKAFLRESESIAGQRMILQSFIEKQEELTGCTVIEAVDDGYSGTNFDRPGIQLLLDMSKTQKVNCIIVKDLSRFGRNYLEVGNYLEQIFPFMGIRFISVNDNFDSFKNWGAAGAIDIGFKNIVYEAYSKDLSIKIRSVRKSMAEQGKFITAFAPYGYSKDKTNKNHLIVDEECAAVIRRIYNLHIQGIGKTEIARILNKEEIPTPLMVRKERHEKFHRYQCQEKSHWTSSIVSRILSDQRYTGDGIYGKVRSESVGSKKDTPVPKDDWIIVDNIHESIIERDLFEAVQIMKKSHNYNRTNNETALAQKLVCKVCNHTLKKIVRGNKVCFQCATRVNTNSYDCSTDIITENQLESIILSYLHALSLIVHEVSEKSGIQTKPLSASSFSKIQKTQAAIKQKECSIFKLYEAFKTNKLNEAAYLKQMEGIETDIAALKERLKQQKTMCDAAIETEKAVSQEDHGNGNESMLFKALSKKIADDFIKVVYLERCGVITFWWRFRDPLKSYLDD